MNVFPVTPAQDPTPGHQHDREQVADLFQALGNPALLRLLELVADRPRSGTALAAALGITTTRLNRQLFVLRQSGLITCADRSGLREWAVRDHAVMQVVTQVRAMVHTMSPSQPGTAGTHPPTKDLPMTTNPRASRSSGNITAGSESRQPSRKGS